MSAEFSVSPEMQSGVRPPTGADRRLVPMKVGAAVVYVEAAGDEPVLADEPSEFHTVGPSRTLVAAIDEALGIPAAA
jgi:hypothetical protein